MGLQSRIKQLMEKSVADSTRATYDIGFQTYSRFIAMNNLKWHNNMPPISEDLLMCFVTYCHQTMHLAYSTIKLYLCGVRFQYMVSGTANPFDATGNNLHRLHILLKGIKRSNSTSPSTRQPITGSVLAILSKLLRKGLFQSFIDVMLETVCIIAFFAFLRCSEFTCKLTFDHTSNLCIGDIEFQEDHIVLTLKQSKADPFRKGVHIKLFCIGTDICPMCQLRNT